MLESTGRGHQIALWSNTNDILWNRDDIAGRLAPLINQRFLSYETVHLKPDSSSFEDVLSHSAIDAEKILFLDDNPLNIEAAIRCGMRAKLTRGFDSLVQNLSNAGVNDTFT